MTEEKHPRPETEQNPAGPTASAASNQAADAAPVLRLSYADFLRHYFKLLALLVLICLLLGVPYSFWWLYQCGDVAVERAVTAQSQGRFALFGSGVSQDFVDYKLQLYAASKPEIVAIGSSRVMQFRSTCFSRKFLNMGGVAGNLAVLRSTVEAMLAIHEPQALILGLDFWWFLPQWEAKPLEEVPPTKGSYTYSLESLKKPWAWLLEGKISLKELAAPLLGPLGAGFTDDRFGIMAQQTDDGFGPDGSWYYTAEVTGQKRPFDYQFHDTLSQIAHGIKAFYHAPAHVHGPSREHCVALAEIVCKLKARGIETYIFIAPMSERALAAMNSQPEQYSHLFRLRETLARHGLDVRDHTDPRSFGSNDCEFIDGFHGGEVAYLRLLKALADHWPGLLSFVTMECITAHIRDWQGFALIPDPRLTALPEQDFMQFGCPKRYPAGE